MYYIIIQLKKLEKQKQDYLRPIDVKILQKKEIRLEINETRKGR